MVTYSNSGRFLMVGAPEPDTYQVRSTTRSPKHPRMQLRLLGSGMEDTSMEMDRWHCFRSGPNLFSWEFVLAAGDALRFREATTEFFDRPLCSAYAHARHKTFSSAGHKKLRKCLNNDSDKEKGAKLSSRMCLGMHAIEADGNNMTPDVVVVRYCARFVNASTSQKTTKNPFDMPSEIMERCGYRRNEINMIKKVYINQCGPAVVQNVMKGGSRRKLDTKYTSKCPNISVDKTKMW